MTEVLSSDYRISHQHVLEPIASLSRSTTVMDRHSMSMDVDLSLLLLPRLLRDLLPLTRERIIAVTLASGQHGQFTIRSSDNVLETVALSVTNRNVRL